MEGAEAGAPAHVTGQSVAKSHPVGTRVVEKPAAQKKVTCRADGGHCTGVAHQGAVIVIKVDAVCIHGTIAHQAKVVVHAKVAARARKQLARPADFVQVLGHMRLDPHIGVTRRQLTRAAQLRRRAGGGKPRRDGVAQAVHTVPALDQRLGIDEALFGVVAHTIGRVAILQHLAGDQAQMLALRLGEQGIHRGGVRGGKSQRRGHAVAQQLCYKKLSYLRTVIGRCKAFFMRKCVVLQPGQQAVSGRTDHVRLREVDVHVHKPGRKDAPRQVGDRLVCVLRAECLP